MTREIRHGVETANLPAMVLDGVGAVVSGPTSGRLVAADALNALAREAHLVCHAPWLIGRLAGAPGGSDGSAADAFGAGHFDVAELFAFAAPAVAATPTARSFARALGLPAAPDECGTLRSVADELLRRLARADYAHLRETAEINNFLARSNWPWAGPVRRALEMARPGLDPPGFATGLNVWDRLDDWEDEAPRPPGSHHAVSAADACAELKRTLGSDAEARPVQLDYTATAALAFQPRQTEEANHVVLAEAGTGLGKTLGYLAPAWLWARRNDQPVWISTYTKNLQRQIEQELARIVPDPQERRERVVIRKGRENYVCLLNMQDTFARLGAGNPRTALLAALIARWARYSRDGDMVGGDFPAWLIPLALDDGVSMRIPGPAGLGLTDRRGECIYAACPHYRKCFIERAVRRARKADIVVANHALVLHHAAAAGAPDGSGTADGIADRDTPGGLRRLVFDEGHHLFDAADSAFSVHLSGLESAELRRWIRGPEARRGRGRSLEDRLGDLIDDDEVAIDHLDAIRTAAGQLPGPGWQQRIQAGNGQGRTETFLQLVRQQVMARAQSRSGNSSETDCRPLVDGLLGEARALAASLAALRAPMINLAKHLKARLDDEAASLRTGDRIRIEAMVRSLHRRGEVALAGWIDVLDRLEADHQDSFVDWFSIDRARDVEVDTGLHSHFVDPSEPLAAAVLARADGLVITSATLKDNPPDVPDDWQSAEMRTGASHLPWSVTRAGYPSPFDYAANARIIVVNDVNRDDMDQIAAAYRELFVAAGGSALGLFTAISRLRAVHGRIAPAMALNGLTLYAQHVDPIDTGTLVDMFRAEQRACLLGTDAVRDGIDVPGGALHLMVMDRVPWAQPTILERARRERFGKSRYQDMIVRLRLRQAFGRLIRTASDRGVFVMLDSRLATRFTTAFPADVEIERIGLVDALEAVEGFLRRTLD